MTAMTFECYLYILPLIILGFIIFSYFAYIIGLCIFMVNNLLETCLYILVFNVFSVLLLWSFLSTTFTPIATVPAKYKLTDEEVELVGKSDNISKNSLLEVILVKKNLTVQTRYPVGQVRFCLKCKHIKPDRSRHCSSCGVCVLKMDHHCPFVNNCIGFSNYKSFILLQLYTALYCLYIVCTSLKYLPQIMNNPNPTVVVCFFIAVFFGLFGITLLVYHGMLTARNETTIDKIQVPIIVVENSTFDLGCRKNFEEVFGSNCWTWLLPVFTGLGSGETFPIRIRNPA